MQHVVFKSCAACVICGHLSTFLAAIGFDSVFAAPSCLIGWSGWVGLLQEGGIGLVGLLQEGGNHLIRSLVA